MRLFLYSAFISAFLATSAFATDVRFKIGFIGGFSGTAKAYGEACKNGFELGLKDRNSPVKVVYEDDQFTPAKTVSAFKKLSEIDHVDLIISIGSTASNAIAPLAQEKRLPLIAWASDPRVSQGNNMVVRSWLSGQREGQKIAEVALKHQYQKVAFLITTSDYSRSVKEGFTKDFPSGNLILSEEYPGDSLDFKPFLLKAKSHGIDSLGLCLNPGQPGAIAKQARELGLSLKLFGCENFHDQAESAVAGNSLWGTWFVTSRVAPDFQERYSKIFGNDNVISGAAMHYDLAGWITEIAEKNLKRQEFVRAMLASPMRRGAMKSPKRDLKP